MRVYENWQEYLSEPDCGCMFQKYSDKCWYMDDKPPFRDPESLRLMKETYNIEFVEGSWYSIFRGEDRTHIEDIPAALKYALMLLRYSRRGRFLSGEYLDDDKIWAVLSDMPFDILIFCTWSELWDHGKTFCKNTSFLILNYPLFGEKIELYVKKREIDEEDPFYRKLYDENVFDRSYRLFVGMDRQYYTDVHVDFRYHWREDIDGILRYIDELKPEYKIAEINDSYSVAEFAGKLPEYSRDSFDRLPDQIKIINHMYVMPEIKGFGCFDYLGHFEDRKVCLMIVEKNYDGTYRLSGDLFKDLIYDGEQGDILEKAVGMGRADGELVILFINVPNVLRSAKGLENTLWAARVYQDSIELFDKYDGLKLFAAVVREALASGNCEISKDFL